MVESTARRNRSRSNSTWVAMSMSYLPPAAMRRSPSAPRSFVTLVKVSRDSVSKSVSSALGFVNMGYGTSCSSHGVAGSNSIWHPTVSTTETRLGSIIFSSDSPAKNVVIRRLLSGVFSTT